MLHLGLVVSLVALGGMSESGPGLLAGRIEPVAPEMVSDESLTRVKGLFRVVNSGTADLVVRALSIRGAGRDAFTTYGVQTGYALEPGRATGFSVDFKPPRAQSYNAEVVATLGYSSQAIDRAVRALRAEHQPPLDKLKRLLGQLRASGPDFEQLELRAMRMELDWQGEKERLDKAVAEKEQYRNRLYLLREKMLDEMRRGEYCSECKRPRSQVELEESETFGQHLKRVKGVAKPADRALLLKKEQEFDQRIANAEREVKRAEQNYADAYSRHLTRKEGLERERAQARRRFGDDVADLEGQIARREQTLEKEVKRLESLRVAVHTATYRLEGSVKEHE